MNSDADRIAAFRVGVELQGFQGGGTLTIGPGQIVLTTDRLTRAVTHRDRVVHTDPNVGLVCARLVPPWFNTSLLLHDGPLRVRAITWVLARRQFRVALDAAGFTVVETRRWFSLGARPAAHRLRAPWVSRRVRIALVAATLVTSGAVAVAFVGSPLLLALIAAVGALNVFTIARH